MILTITFPPGTEQKLRERAAQTGQTVEGFVCQLVERAVLGPNGCRTPEPDVPATHRTFDEVFAPGPEDVAESGITAGELGQLLEEGRQEPGAAEPTLEYNWSKARRKVRAAARTYSEQTDAGY